MSSDDMISAWLAKATTEQLEAQYETLAPSQEFGHRDAEMRAKLRQRVRAEIDKRKGGDDAA